MLAQVMEAAQNAMTFTARYRGTSALAITLDALFIDCQMEWEDVYAGRFDEGEIPRRRHAMMKRRTEAVAKYQPGGLPVKRKLFALAEDAEGADAVWRQGAAASPGANFSA